jgi:polar amino acid transport system permease protein
VARTACAGSGHALPIGGAGSELAEPALQFISKYISYLVLGTGMTLFLTTVAFAVGVVLGTLAALGKISRQAVVRSACSFYVWATRGTPLLLQIYIVYFALPVVKINLGRVEAALLALSVNAGAYAAEIIRAGIQSIDKGQMEAARSLGMSYGQAMRRVILPQAVRRLLPPLGNEFIALLKDSSLVSTIGLYELLRRSQTIVAATFRPIEIYITTGLLYLALTTMATYVISRYERALEVYD